jgi:hypothetical protein
MGFSYRFLGWVKIRTELCPPNPKELLITVLIGFDIDIFGV